MKVVSMGEKKVKGRKRHIVTDTQGQLLDVKVHAANTYDSVGGCSVFEEALKKYPTLEGVCIEISARIAPGGAILAKRWVVERTFAWLGHFRRLSKDYEIAIKSAENNVMIAHSILLLGRLGQL